MKTFNIQTLHGGVAENTPLGTIRLAVSEHGLVAVQIGGEDRTFFQRLATRFGVSPLLQNSKVESIISQVREYLDGERQTFEIDIHWGIMSAFQQKTLKAVCQVPYGETRTYGQIAAQTGIPQAPRAVGRANAANPMPLVIPCHRLVGVDGSLRGYGGGDGIETKRWLLTMEHSRV